MCRTHTYTHPPRCFLPLAVSGSLKGYDQLLNLVLDDAHEALRGVLCPTVLALGRVFPQALATMSSRLRPLVPWSLDPEDPLRLTDATRSLGLVVLRGTAVMVVGPTDGTEEIANPFLQAAEEGA